MMRSSIADGKEVCTYQPGGQAAEHHSNLPSDTAMQTQSHLPYCAHMQMHPQLLRKHRSPLTEQNRNSHYVKKVPNIMSGFLHMQAQCLSRNT